MTVQPGSQAQGVYAQVDESGQGLRFAPADTSAVPSSRRSECLIELKSSPLL